MGLVCCLRGHVHKSGYYAMHMWDLVSEKVCHKDRKSNHFHLFVVCCACTQYKIRHVSHCLSLVCREWVLWYYRGQKWDHACRHGTLIVVTIESIYWSKNHGNSHPMMLHSSGYSPPCIKHFGQLSHKPGPSGIKLCPLPFIPLLWYMTHAFCTTCMIAHNYI